MPGKRSVTILIALMDTSGPGLQNHTVRVVAKNEYGIDPSPAEFSFYYEWVPDTPIANIRTSIPDVMEQRTITIAFEGKDDMNVGDKTGAYELDYSYRLIPRYMDWSLKSRKDSVTFTKLKNGPYFFQVRAIDKNGNESIV